MMGTGPSRNFRSSNKQRLETGSGRQPTYDALPPPLSQAPSSTVSSLRGLAHQAASHAGPPLPSYLHKDSMGWGALGEAYLFPLPMPARYR